MKIIPLTIKTVSVTDIRKAMTRDLMIGLSKINLSKNPERRTAALPKKITPLPHANEDKSQYKEDFLSVRKMKR